MSDAKCTSRPTSGGPRRGDVGRRVPVTTGRPGVVSTGGAGRLGRRRRREIHQEDVEKAYRRTIQADAPLSDDEATVAKLNLLDQLISEDVLLARAKELQIVLPESELDAAFDEERKNIPDDTFDQALAARNLTTADVRDALRRDLIARKVIEHEVSSKIAVTDQEVDGFFQANKAQFNLPEDSFHIAQIVVTSIRDAGLNNRTGDDATTAQAAAEKVQMLMERLQSGTPFSNWRWITRRIRSRRRRAATSVWSRRRRSARHLRPLRDAVTEAAARQPDRRQHGGRLHDRGPGGSAGGGSARSRHARGARRHCEHAAPAS